MITIFLVNLFLAIEEYFCDVSAVSAACFKFYICKLEYILIHTSWFILPFPFFFSSFFFSFLLFFFFSVVSFIWLWVGREWQKNGTSTKHYSLPDSLSNHENKKRRKKAKREKLMCVCFSTFHFTSIRSKEASVTCQNATKEIGIFYDNQNKLLRNCKT